MPLFVSSSLNEQRAPIADLPGTSPELPFAPRLEIGPKAEVPRLMFAPETHRRRFVRMVCSLPKANLAMLAWYHDDQPTGSFRDWA
jgi:hypothetical protein